jgi:hypothetical protein
MVCREKPRNVEKCLVLKMYDVYLMELVGDVLGWVELEVFGAGWRCLEVFWAGLRCCGLVPIGDFDITRRYTTRREMLRNVEKMSRNVKMSSFVEVATKKKLLKARFFSPNFITIFPHFSFYCEISTPFRVI